MSEYLNLSNYPKDWQVQYGSEFLTLGSGVSPSTILFSLAGNTPYMKVDDFNHPDNHTYIKSTKLRFDDEGTRVPLASPNSIVIAKRGAAISKNRVRIAKHIIAVDTNLMTIAVKCSHDLTYFKYLLELINLTNIADTTSIPQLNNFHLNEAAFCFPLLEKQHKIASILTSVDEVIEKTEAQISKLQDLKRGMMQELLTQGIGHTEFKDSPVGRIPKGWEVILASNILSVIESGWSPQCETRPASTGDWGILKTTAVTWHGFNSKENKRLPDSLEPRSNIQVRKGDVLITRAGPSDRVGVVAYVDDVPEQIMLSDKIIRIQVDTKRCIPQFFALWLSGHKVQKYFSDRTTGLAQSQTNISQEIIKKTPMLLPGIEEQEVISGTITALSSKIQKTINKHKQLV